MHTQKKNIHGGMKADTDAVINAFWKNEQLKKVFWTVFVAMAGSVMARVVDPVTSQLVMGIIPGMGIRISPQLSFVGNTGYQGVQPQVANKPYSGSFSLHGPTVNTGKSGISFFFCSCGKYA